MGINEMEREVGRRQRERDRGERDGENQSR